MKPRSAAAAMLRQEIYVIAATYWMLFLLGFAGNMYLLSTICRLSCGKRRRRRRNNTAAMADLQHIKALCVSDTVTLLCVPLIIADLIVGQWPFGLVLCKLHWYMESIGKLFSTYVLLSMSIRRYCIVCHSDLAKRLFSTRKSLAIILALIIGTSGLVFPLPYHAEVVTIVERDSKVVANKCNLNNMHTTAAEVYSWVLFVAGHFVPSALILILSLLILVYVRNQRRRSMVTSGVPMGRVTMYTIAICLFYGVCWFPYWIATTQTNDNEALDQNSIAFFYVMYAIHALPMVSAAMNWILYGLLNKQLSRLREQQDASTNSMSYGSMRFGRSLSSSRRQSSGIHLRVPESPQSNSRCGSSSDSECQMSKHSSLITMSDNGNPATPSPTDERVTML